MTNIEKNILSYLEIETNYALLINGERGMGKTFFVKNSIIPRISKIKLFHDHRRSYKPVYISLFGLKSLDEVFTLLAFELLPFLKGRSAKISMGVVKMLTRGLLNYQHLGEVDDILKSVANVTKSAIDTKDFVMIIDDLDRLAPGLSIGELVGFINSLVEHDNNKVIIIADQDQVGEQDIYKAVKEKTIGTTIQFTPLFERTLEEIITSRYKDRGYGTLYRHLTRLSPLIIASFAAAGTENLRTLIFFLQHYLKIFTTLYDDLELAKEEPGELNLLKLDTVSRFTLAVVIEFKKGQLTYTETQGIDKVDEIHAAIHADWLRESFTNNARILGNSPAVPAEQKVDYRDNFVERYYGRDTYRFYPSLYRFITGGEDLNGKELLMELKKSIDDRIHQVLRQDELINELSYPQVYDLSNDELLERTNELYDFALRGQLSLDRYLTAFHFLERFPEILKNDPRTLTDKLIAAINDHGRHYSYIPLLKESFHVPKDQQNHEFFAEIFKASVKVNEQNKCEQDRQKDLELFDLFIRDQQSFYTMMNEKFDHRAVLASWDIDRFYEVLSSLKANQVREWNMFLANKYNLYEAPKEKETGFLTALRDKLKEDVTGEPDFRKYILEGTLGVLTVLLAPPSEDLD